MMLLIASIAYLAIAVKLTIDLAPNSENDYD